MAVNADSVVVELIAKTDGYAAAVNGAANVTTNAMSRIEQSATKAEGQIVRSAGAMANAQRNLGRQISDIGTQLAGGQSPFLIIAQQAPQVADALADTGGKAASVAAFFAGPWGAALLAAGSALGVLLSKVIETGGSVDDLVKKLKENDEKARLAAQAQRIFENSLYGAMEASKGLTKQLREQNQSQVQAARSALILAEAERQKAIGFVRAEVARRAAATRDAQTAADGSNFRTTGEAQTSGTIRQNAERIRTSRALATATKQEADAREFLADQESRVVEARIPLLRLDAVTDANEKATRKHSDAVDALTAAYRKASAEAAKLNGNARIQAQARANSAYQSGLVSANKGLEADMDAIREANKKGPSAETLARRAEAARVRALRADEAYNTELETLNQQIITARKAQTDNAETLAGFERDAVAAELRKRVEQINTDEAAKKYDKAQADLLRQRAQQVADQRTAAINADLARKQADDRLAIELASGRNAQAMLQAQAALVDTNEQRRKIEIDLLRLKYDELRAEQQAALKRAQDRGDTAGAVIAQSNLSALPGLQKLEQAGVERRYAGEYENYRRSIRGDFESTKETVESIEVRALDAVTDSLTTATTAALGLKGALGDVVGQLIRIGIQRRLIGPLADQLFGKADGSTQGAVGGALRSIIGAFGGRASGGYVGPGQTVRVNEQRPGVELLRMGPQGGTVIPLGQAAAARPAGGGDRHFNISVDARNSVTPAGFAQQISSAVLRQAAAMDAQTVRGARAGLPAALDRYGKLGTTG